MPIFIIKRSLYKIEEDRQDYSVWIDWHLCVGELLCGTVLGWWVNWATASHRLYEPRPFGMRHGCKPTKQSSDGREDSFNFFFGADQNLEETFSWNYTLFSVAYKSTHWWERLSQFRRATYLHFPTSHVTRYHGAFHRVASVMLFIFDVS